MSNTVIIIPSRLKAKRLPNKPLKLIKDKEIILHVYNLAVKSGAGEVLVATPDKKISELIDNNGGKSFLSKELHETGTDRVFEAFKNFYSSEPKTIINLQGDMPNLDPNSILFLSDYLNKGLCDVVTLASSIKNKSEIEDRNVVKVITNNDIEKSGFSEALDFKRSIDQTKNKFIYHHVGIYGYKRKALETFIGFDQSESEIERKLEQMRAIENGMKIVLGLIDELPISVDTQEDLEIARRSMDL